MSTFKHGLVIGKFYPPHAGHHYLIRAAADHCEQVTVVAMAASHENIPLEVRVSCLREAFSALPHVATVGVVDDIPVDYDDPDIWLKHVALMREGVTAADEFRLPAPVDAVFTSEPYGIELARHFSAVPVCLDQSRLLYPVSGTSVRQSPSAQWEHLDPAIRSWLALRVVIVGAESTGKTTLSQALAASLRTQGGIWTRTEWVPEYGRERSQNKLAILRGQAMAAGRPQPAMDAVSWHSDEFLEIACRQASLEEESARRGGPTLIADTDAFATSIWHERYLGHRSCSIEATMPATSHRRLYLLTDVDSVPFEQDGMRDGESVRGWMHSVFKQRLDEMHCQWHLITGNKDDFLQQALDHIEAAQSKAWQFTKPLG